MSDLEELFGHMAERFGLVRREDRQRELGRQLGELASREGLTDVEAIDRALLDDDFALSLARSLTIGETHFMRCAPHFDRISDHIAEILGRGDPARTVQILSAGCSTGEEPYSVAITAADRVGSGALGRLEILGVDINEDSVAHARRASYRPWSFRGAPPWLLTRFTRGCGGEREVSPAIRKCTGFRHRPVLDHLQSLPSDVLDVVLFRNVAIYLTAEANTAIYGEIARVLRPGGLLVVSPSDPRPEQQRLEPIQDPTASVYQRAAGAAPSVRIEPTAVPVSQATRASIPRAERGPDRSPAVQPRRSPSTAPEPERFEPAAIRLLASSGRRELALARARDWTRRDPDAGRVFLLLGQILLEDGRTTEAVEELRRAVFLASGDPLIRFWYASALLAAGRDAEARRQISTTRKALVDYRPDTLLGDGETRSHELAEAACFLEDSLS